MEENQEHIQDLMRRFGFSEKEALAAHHLDKAWALCEEIHKEAFAEKSDATQPNLEEAARELWEGIHREIYGHVHIHAHFRELYRFLGMKVLERHYPEGWGREPQDEEEDQG